VIVASAPCEPDCSDARRSLGLLMREGYELLLAKAVEDVAE
jgi:hypothetical protein